MIRKMMLLVAAVAATFSAWSAITISPTSRTFAKAGGGGSILTGGSGTWTATTSASWIHITPRTSGDAGVSCVYSVDANFSADTRVGTIAIGGNTFTISQTGYDATISPTSVNYDLNGGSGTVTVTLDAGISWTAKSNADWLTIKTTSGTGPDEITYEVAKYYGVTARSGSFTIASQTLMVTQTGTDVVVLPEAVEKESGADIFSLNVTALATTKWTVTPNASWISIVDDGNGFGDATILLAVGQNPSCDSRSGTVTIGSKTIAVRQKGTGAFAMNILPKTATAAAVGAYGNIAVMATPDLPWHAQSLSSWLVLSTDATGLGNGNVGYVASANPTLETREGQIKFTMDEPYPEVDIVRANSQWAGVDYGTYCDPDVAGWTRCSTFSITRADSLHRLINYNSGAAALYVNENNVLVYQDADGIRPLDFPVSVNVSYYAIGVCDGENSTIYAGLAASDSYKPLITVNKALDATSHGSSTLPSSGTLVYGSSASTHYWRRPLSEVELAKISTYDIKQVDTSGIYSTLIRHASMNARRMWSANNENLACATANGSASCADRFGHNGNAVNHDVAPVCNTAQRISEIKAARYSNYPQGGKVWTYRDYEYNSYYYFTGYEMYSGVSSYLSCGGETLLRYLAADKPSTYSSPQSVNMWVLINAKGVDNQKVFSQARLSATKTWQGEASSLDWYYNSAWNSLPGTYIYEYSPPGRCGVNYSSDAGFYVVENGTRYGPYTDGDILPNVWYMLTLTYTTSKVTIYLNGMEIGNCPIGSTTFCSDLWAAYSNNGMFSLDEVEIFSSALTAAQVKELYDTEKPTELIHTVTQGAVSPMVSTNELTFAAKGGSGSVTVTTAANVQWTASKNKSWITFTSETSNMGSKTVTFDIAENMAVEGRSGTLTFAGLPVAIKQGGLNATVTYDGPVFDVDGGLDYIDVDTEGNASWTAVSDSDWITIMDGENGMGSGSVMFVTDPYNTTSQSRIGSITVAGKKVYITQCGYELSIDPLVAEIGSNAGAGEVGVAAPIDSVWEALVTQPWITITGSRNGVGTGTLRYSVEANTTGETRVGKIIISGTEYTITQLSSLIVNATAAGNGSVAGGGSYETNAKATLTATPDKGYAFSHWTGDMVGSDNPVQVTVDSAKDIQAHFIPEAAAEQLAAQKAAQGGFYTRDQIHNLEVGNLVLDVDSTTGKARIGVQLQETGDLSNPNWKPVNVTTGDLDVGADGTVGIKASATGNAKFFRVVTPQK